MKTLCRGKTLESEKGRRHLELAAVSQKISVLLSVLGFYNAVLRYLIAYRLVLDIYNNVMKYLLLVLFLSFVLFFLIFLMFRGSE